MKMPKAIILPFFLLAGLASASQQPQGGVVGGDNNYHDEDVEGSSLQRRTALSGEDDVAPQQQDAYNNRRLLMCRVDADCGTILETCVNGMCLRTNFPRDDGATYLEDEYAVHSTTTDFYDDYEIDNADEEIVDESRRQLRGNNNNRRLKRNSAECMVGWVYRNCPKNHTCWRRRVGSSWSGNAICVRNDDCLPRNVFASYSWRFKSRFEKKCCSGSAWVHGDVIGCD